MESAGCSVPAWPPSPQKASAVHPCGPVPRKPTGALSPGAPPWTCRPLSCPRVSHRPATPGWVGHGNVESCGSAWEGVQTLSDGVVSRGRVSSLFTKKQGTSRDAERWPRPTQPASGLCSHVAPSPGVLTARTASNTGWCPAQAKLKPGAPALGAPVWEGEP